METVIKSLATANPPLKVTQQRVFELMSAHRKMQKREKQMYEKILLKGPIETRYFGIDYDEQIFDENQDRLIERFLKYGRTTAKEAAAKAIESAELDAKDIECLVVNTCTGYLCPGLSSYLVQDLGLDRGTRVIDMMGMGCGAAIPNLRCASQMMSEKNKAALSVAVEICSATVFIEADEDLIVSNCIFGDGASAAVIARNGISQQKLVSILDFESLVLPHERDILKYRSCGGRLRNVLARNVPTLAAKCAKEIVNNLLKRNRLDKGQIAYWAVHPGGSKVLTAIQQKLDLPENSLDCSRQILREYGNMSSPSVMFVLERIMETARPQEKQKCILLSFGAGFTAFAALVEF